MERTALALAAILVGCAGPAVGAGSGTVTFGEREPGEVTYCEWRHEENPPGTYAALRVYAETELGPLFVRHPIAGDDVVEFDLLGDVQDCTGSLVETTGAWVVTADCDNGPLRVEITGCMMAD